MKNPHTNEIMLSKQDLGTHILAIEQQLKALNVRVGAGAMKVIATQMGLVKILNEITAALRVIDKHL
jgi:ribosomal protein L28